MLGLHEPIKGRHYHYFVYDDLISSGRIEPDEALFFLQSKEWNRCIEMVTKKKAQPLKIPKKYNADVEVKPEAPVEVPEIELLRARLEEAEKLNQYYANQACTKSVAPSYNTSVTTERLKAVSQKSYRYSELFSHARMAAERFPLIERYIVLPHFDQFEPDANVVYSSS